MANNSKYLITLVAAVVLSLVFLVDVERAASADIIVPTGQPTIQSAIDKASAGDTIIVEDGLYRENLLIKASIVLRSRNGSEKSIIEPVEAKNDVIRVLEVPGGVTISGFTLKGSEAAGLRITKSPKSKVFGNTISGNNYGLQLEHSSSSIIKENLFNTNDTGLYIFFSDKCLIEGNEASSNTNVGMLLHSSHENILTKNVTNRNVWNGITLSSSNNNKVTANRSLKNTYAIVVSESSGNLIEDNATMPRLYYILPVALVYLAIMFYLLERKILILYYHYRYGE